MRTNYNIFNAPVTEGGLFFFFFFFFTPCLWDFPRQDYWSGLPFPSADLYLVLLAKTLLESLQLDKISLSLNFFQGASPWSGLRKVNSQHPEGLFLLDP